jgi:hypothetical protein
LRLSSFRSLAGITAVLAFARCTTESCACEPVVVTALLYGQVTSPAAEPVVGALVHAYSVPADGCNADAVSGSDYGFIATLVDGTYSLQLAAAAAALDSVCIFVFAQPPQGADGLVESDTTLVVLDFDPAQLDSARVDPVLRAQ